MPSSLEKRVCACAAFCALVLTVVSPRLHAAQDNARTRVQAAIQAMGGEERLQAIHSLRFKAIGQRTMLEQSERPEGPWLMDYFQVSEFVDFAHKRQRVDRESRGCGSSDCWDSAAWLPSTYFYDNGAGAMLVNGKQSPARRTSITDSSELLALSPDRVLLEALAAPDLHSESDTALRGFTHHVVGFTLRGATVRLLLSAYTALPSAVEITRTHPYNTFLGPWGDLTSRITYTFWQLEPGGVRYPRQWNSDLNGQPDWMWTINELSINPVENENHRFVIDSQIRTAPTRGPIDEWPLGFKNDPPSEIVPGVVQVRGFWNLTEVKQADGIVIIEGPISNGYSAKVIADAQVRFPGLPIKAVITTSDSWPHIGGLREYAARGIPIYALDLNRTILQRLFSAPHKLAPDDLAKSGKRPIVHYISARTQLGTGSNRLEIIPYREQTGERQMMVYFPDSKLLYTSDLFQRAGGEWFLPETLWEALDAVRREKLDVDRSFGMHYEPVAWSEIEAAVKKQERPAEQP